MNRPGKQITLLGPARLHRLLSEEAQFDRQRPILLVHGAYHGAWCWEKWMQRLSEDGRRVYALDLRGHGGLEPDGEFVRAGMAEMVEDIALAIDSIPSRPIVVGHSVGGLLVVLAALQRDVAGLLLLCPSPPGNLPGAAKVPAIDETRLADPLSMEQARERYAPHLDDEEAAALADMLCAESPRLLNDRYQLRVPVDTAALDRDLPILVVEGGRDNPERHPPGQDAAIATFYRGEHLRLDDAPHNLMLGPGWRGWFKAIWKRFDDMV